MMVLLAVAVGGALGASIRYGVNQVVTQIVGMPMFWATLIVNVLGCLLMGKAYTYFLHNPQVSEIMRAFVSVGILGALTTWSTFSMETVLMIQHDELAKAIGYTMVTTFCCFLAFWLGVKT